ncbi:MAG: carbon storage regulator [Lachnospiraceae bacterium]|nr:carbon storage regulator [Lachnospiraceae bacterium]
MLKLTVKAGEYLLVGDDVKVVFTGGSSNNLHILVDAPKSMNIVRSTALEKYGMAAEPGNEVKHHKDKELSPEAKEKIRAILMEERRKAKKQKQ